MERWIAFPCHSGQDFMLKVCCAAEHSFLVSGVCKEMCTALLLSPSVQGPEGHRPPHEVEMRHLHLFSLSVDQERWHSQVTGF